MRRISLLPLLLALLYLTACSTAGQVENQAYVIAMGLDRSLDGGVELSVQVPIISGSQASSEGGSSDMSYLPVSIHADSYDQAIQRLAWALPKEMNLTQIELIVLSEELAAEDGCRELIERIANTERLFSAASVAVCSGRAKAFIQALSPTLGSRIAADVHAAQEHYRSIGVIPDSSLAKLNFLSNSVYSDPAVAYARRVKPKEAEEDKGSEPASQASILTSAQPLLEATEYPAEDIQSPMEILYCGTAVFADGSLRGVLGGEQAILTNLIANRLDSFRFSCGGESLEFTPVGGCRVQVDTSCDPVRIRLSLHLTVTDQEYIPADEVMASALEEALQSTISAAQRMHADPFGFAEVAARRFLTLEDWVAYDWRERFQTAEVEIKLHFTHADT